MIGPSAICCRSAAVKSSAFVPTCWAMARLRSARSATSQFYINLANNAVFDHRGYSPDDFGYAVFGRVLSGMDVCDRIAAVKTHSVGPHEDVPVDPVVIKSVRVKP